METLTRTATWYLITGNSDYYWRAVAPAQAVNAKTCMIPENGGFYAVTIPNDDTEFKWSFDEDADECFINYPDHEGNAAVWIRPDLTRATHAKAMREQFGWRTVAETDDNYVGDPNLNIYMRSGRFDEKIRLQHLKAMASMDAIVFSTGWLRDYYAKEIRKAFREERLKGWRLPDLHVCRNHCPESDWPTRVLPDGPVRVGWMGSPSHLWDVDLIWPALMHARNLGCETWMVGYDPSDPEMAVTSPRAKDKVEQWRKVGFQHRGWEKLDGRTRMALPLDVGLAPLLTNEFTLGKSDIKAIEYAIAGAAPVVWNNLVYRDWVHGETCLKVGSPSEAIDAVDLLVRDENLRERVVAGAQQYIREERGEKQLREEWMAAING